MKRSHDQGLRIGLFYPSTPALHVCSRVIADQRPDVTDPQTHREMAGTCEEIGLDFLFVADRWTPYGPASTASRFQDPILHAPTLGMFLGAVTQHCGIVTTVHTTYHHPAHIARMGATLDRLTGGRWAMNVVTGIPGSDEFALFGLEDSEHDDRYARATRFLEIVRKLWVGEDISYQGPDFVARGQMVGPSPIQARPLIVNAGSSAAGQEFIAREADWVFLLSSQEQVAAKLANIERLAQAHDREPGAVRALLVGSVIVRDSDAEAEAAGQRVRDSIDIEAAREYLMAVMGMESYQSFFAGDDELTALTYQGSGGSGPRLYGSAATVAEQIIAMHRDFACRGIALSFPLWEPSEIRRFGVEVLPILQRAGVWEHPKDRGWSW
ncbi:MAG: LLM class flavin-dependent oxidoreductase [Ilumatobacter fluminis]|uniref:LLM class flavin-dependent oxidoreductase n=1 Tax=Ilumatobacter fluminis TaxID=467091 RepID=UPI0032EF03C8